MRQKRNAKFAEAALRRGREGLGVLLGGFAPWREKYHYGPHYDDVYEEAEGNVD